jgi:hypothetical protein
VSQHLCPFAFCDIACQPHWRARELAMTTGRSCTWLPRRRSTACG